MQANDLVGKKVCWSGMGFNLVTEGGTLWRPTRGKQVCGTVESVEPGRFYQTRENVAWLHVRLDRAWGRYKYAKGYWNEATGQPLDLRHEPMQVLRARRGR